MLNTGNDKFDDSGTECEDPSSYHVLVLKYISIYTDLMERAISWSKILFFFFFFRKAIPSFSLAVKHPKRQTSLYKPLSRLMNLRRL